MSWKLILLRSRDSLGHCRGTRVFRALYHILSVKVFSFPGSAWECMAWRLRLHYCIVFQLVTGQSSEDMGSQAEPGNQAKSVRA